MKLKYKLSATFLHHSCEGWNPVKTSGYATLTRPTIWHHKAGQFFTVFLLVKSVGVTGDGRRYDYVVSLRVVEAVDFMMVRWAYLPSYELLETVSRRIL